MMRKFLLVLPILFAYLLVLFCTQNIDVNALKIYEYNKLFTNKTYIDNLENVTYDIRAKISVNSKNKSKSFDISGRRETPIVKQRVNYNYRDKNIVIVAVDDVSRNVLSNYPEKNLLTWPFRRDIWGELTEYIEQGNPKLVIFDLTFPGVNSNGNADIKFSNILKKYDNIILGMALLRTSDRVEKTKYKPMRKTLEVLVEDSGFDFTPITYSSHTPISDIYTQHNIMGVVNVVENSEKIRKTRLLYKLDKDGQVYFVPSMGLAAITQILGADDKVIIKKGELHYKNRIIPIESDATTYISWHGRELTYPYYSFSDVIMGHVPPSEFEDKIVIIGQTEAGSDIHSTSLSYTYPGPEVNATIIDNLLNDTNPKNYGYRKFITKSDIKTNVILNVIFCLAIMVCVINSGTSLLALFSSLMLIILYVLTCCYLYSAPEIRLWIPIVVPFIYQIVTLVMAYFVRYQIEQYKKNQIADTFGKFVSPSVLSTITSTDLKLSIKSTRKKVTVLFCDVKNFTTMSEKCDPDELINTLNEVFNVVVEIIFANKGTVDKFIGDCVMAYWGDPVPLENASFLALKTAFDINKKLEELNEKNKLKIKMKFGINTGIALLGLVGSDKLMSYTAMGDTVNIASRLESECSQLNADILISKSTYDEVYEVIEAEEVGFIKLKGKDEEVGIYKPIRIKDMREVITEAVEASRRGVEH